MLLSLIAFIKYIKNTFIIKMYSKIKKNIDSFIYFIQIFGINMRQQNLKYNCTVIIILVY